MLILNQTVPQGDVAVCPLSTVQYTCVADTTLIWREAGSNETATYTILPPTSNVNDTAMAGSFQAILTYRNGDTLTSTATIDSVSLTENGINISCQGITSAASKLIRVQGTSIHYFVVLLCMFHKRCPITSN